LTEAARYAIITPYYKEEDFLIERCIRSVNDQIVRADHILVADGFPRSWIDDADVRHIKLDRCHGDYGNTPRGIGALIAIAEEYHGIGFLDADNWLEKDHVKACLVAGRAASAPCDYVIAQRTFRRPDETIIPLREEPNHVDTNCFFFLRGSFSVIPHWAMMPKNLAQLGDCYFLAMMRSRPFTVARVPAPTVNYFCMWESFYRTIGETPPPGAKSNIDVAKIELWLRSLERRDLEIACRLTGVSPIVGLAHPDPPILANTPRNARCPCGSGKKFKLCHGALTAG
jgi:hypothetical protein